MKILMSNINNYGQNKKVSAVNESMGLNDLK